MIKFTLENGTMYHTEVVEDKSFPDGTALMKINASDLFSGRFTKADIKWFYENEKELVRLIYLVGCLRTRNIHRITLLMPYVPNARQDRVKDCHDVFTLKYFANVINKLYFDTVTILDPHSHVCEALLDRVNILSPKKYISMAIDKYKPDMLFFPDEGAMKRYTGIIEYPFAFGVKERDWKTGKIADLSIICNQFDVKDKNVLIVDDICSRGGTFFFSAKKLKELGAKNVYLYVTHCENTILEGELLKSDILSGVTTTNSIFTESHEKIGVIEIQ